MSLGHFRVWRWAVVSGVLALAASGAMGRAEAQTPGIADSDNLVVIERILVKVNGEILTQTDLESRQVNEIRRRGVQPTTSAELANLVAEVTPDVIVSAVDELLMVQRGRELGYALSDAQFDDIVANLREENGFIDDESLAQALMEAEGMTIDDLRDVMERQMLVSQVQQMEVLNRVNMTDTEAREYYDAHLDEFTEPAMATIREILIAVPEGSGGDVSVFADEQTRTVAQTTAARLRDGEDFATVAGEVSDSPSKANGGLIGPLLVSEYSETIQRLISSLEVGDVTDPIRTPLGYQVIMLEERVAAVATPFDQVRDSIKDTVFSDRRTAEFSAFLDELREGAIIEWKNEELERLYNQQRATQSPVDSL